MDLAEPDLVGELRRAAAEGTVVHIVYTALGSGSTTERDIEPWTVFSTMGNWYVAAHCRLAGGERVFRIDRIQEAEPTGETFEPPAEPPPPDVLGFVTSPARAAFTVAVKVRYVQRSATPST